MGVRALFCVGADYAVPLVVLAVFMLAAPFLVSDLHRDNPFFWNSAGMAKIIDMERYHNKQGTPMESILFTYTDLRDVEQRKFCVTKKCGFFVPENSYRLVKLKDDWNTVTLADLPFSERFSEFSDVRWFVTRGIELIVMAIGIVCLSYWLVHWPLKLLRSGNHALATFSREEKPWFIARMFGLKKKTFQFTDNNGETHEFSLIRGAKKNESSVIDVFYDPQNPKRTITLLAYGAPEWFASYSPESDSFKAALLLTVWRCCYWLFYLFLWYMMIASFISHLY